MKSKYKWFSILMAFAIVGVMTFWPSQSAEAAKCIEDPEGREEFRVALNSSINDEGYLVVDDSLAETQPPLHWKNKSIRLSWDYYVGAEYRLRRHDAKSDKIDADGNYLEVYAQQANDAEEWSTATSAVRPNHASAMRFWYVDLKLNGKIMDTAQLFWVEVRCGQTTSSSRHMRAQFLEGSVGEDPAPAELAYPRGTYVTNVMWNPRVEAILAERRAAVHATPVPATPVPATPVPATPVPAPAPAELTAEFRNVPLTHNGRDPFTMELHFSEDIRELNDKTVRHAVLWASNGRVTKIRRHTNGNNQGWVITVQPTARDIVMVGLRPRNDCADAGAICSADGTNYSGGMEMQQIAFTAPAPAALTAEFRNLPLTHNGSDPFTLELHFSEHIPELGYRTVRDTALEVTNGGITKAKRHTSGSNQAWIITVQPASRQAVVVALPATADCDDTGAICSADGAKLSSNLSRQIAFTAIDGSSMPSLTAEFRNVASTHDGTTRFSLELHFSENVPELSYKTVRDSALEVSNGRIMEARRHAKGSNQGWIITIQPTAQQTIEVLLPATTDCDDTGAICVDGGMMSSRLLAQILYE